MYQFIGLAWEPTEKETSTTVRRLLGNFRATGANYQPAVSEDGLIVLHAVPRDGGAMCVYRLPQGTGVVLGRVFPARMDGWHANWSWSPSAGDATEIIRTRGQWLIREMWGSYLAFLRDVAGRETIVIRDSSGKLPCYRFRHSRIDIFFADPAVLSAFGLSRPSLNWNYVSAFLCSSQLQTRESGLEGITELLAGDCFHRTSGGNGKQHSAWSPETFLRRPLINHFESAVRAVRATTISCVHAWASAYDTIIHNLSGGLDSTIVLACLMQSERPPRVVCVNRFGNKSAEDERVFARLASSMLNLPLLEMPNVTEAQVIDETLTHLPVTTKPTVSGAFGAIELALVQTLSNRVGARSIWTGEGGDHLFMQTSLPFGPMDYAALRGLRLGLLNSLRDAVRLSKMNYWYVLNLLWKKHLDLLERASGRTPIAAHPFLTQEARLRVPDEYLRHPWMADTEDLPPGQRFQALALCEVLNRHRPLPGLEATYEHHPLLSQPLLELCLRIPSHIHLAGGIDRAVERAAFADMIPGAIAARRQKGQSTFSILDTIHRSGPYIRDLLLGGMLVKEGIVDRSALGPYVRGERPVDLTTFWPLLSCIAAELWIRNWLNYPWGSLIVACNPSPKEFPRLADYCASGTPHNTVA